MQKLVVFLIAFLFVLNACVSPKIHNTLTEEYQNKKIQLKEKEKEIIFLNGELESKSNKVGILSKKISDFRTDSLQNGKSLIVLQSKYNELSDTYDLLASKNSRYIAEKAKETKKLLEQLEQAQTELFSKEDDLNKLERSLQFKQEELQKTQKDLELRAQRVTELELMIAKQDSAVTVLKQRVSKALVGLAGEGLTIIQKKGKVYILLEENLLFESGKYEVNNNGIVALNKLAVVLGSQKDLEILIEGHTDSIPLSGKGLVKDNWDLSVMRATNVVKVLTKNPTLEPLQLTAAGRAEFDPIESNKTTEGRRMNRRIEIILSPNLDDLFELLDE